MSQVIKLPFTLPSLFLLIFIMTNYSPTILAITRANRDELRRYIYLRDKMIIERGLKKGHFNSFIDMDFHASSGIKTLMGDMKDATSDSKSSADKTISMEEVFDQNLNSEKFFEGDFNLAIPLPKFKIKFIRIMTDLFYNYNLGGSFSISNSTDATTPNLKTYLKLDQRFGANFNIEWFPKHHLIWALYSNTRKEVSNQRNTAQSIQNKELFNKDSFTYKENLLQTDISYIAKRSNSRYLIALREFVITSTKDGGPEPVYPHRAFLHFEYQHHFKPKDGLIIHPSLGLHLRTKYQIDDGLYLANTLKKTGVPLEFYSMIDFNFLTITPKIIYKQFQLSYTLKLPLRNPQDQIWVSNIHGLNASFLF